MVNDAKSLEPNAKGYIVECFRKRSKLVIQSQISEEFIHIQNLSGELLVEIICRLPCSKSATQCKCVCKHWAALISHSDFISRFIAYKVGGGFPGVETRASSFRRSIMTVKETFTSLRADNYYEFGTSMLGRINIISKQRQAFATVVRTCCPSCFVRGMMMYLEDPILNPKCLSFSTLPSFENGNLTNLIVVGACNDLFLYRRHDDNKYDYFIYNVETKERLMLPSHMFYHSTDFLTGFICDPHYYYDYAGENHRCNITLSPAYRYAIVVVPYMKRPSTKFAAHILSPKTISRWREIVLSLPRHCLLYEELSFGFGGMLHFLCDEGIIGFDPYDDLNNYIDGIIQCHFIGWPLGFQYNLVRINVHQECIQISNYSNDWTLDIWVLKDYKRGEWFLQYSIATQEWIISDPCIAIHLDRYSFPGFVLGFHPTYSDVIYLRLLSSETVLCNIPVRTLEVVSQARGVLMTINPYFVVVQLMFPVWPTPLPTLV